MSYNYDQQQAPITAYPPPTEAPGYVAPPPAGYPMKEGAAEQSQQVPVETKTRGDGFWEGCCAALCCCCVFETCC